MQIKLKTKTQVKATELLNKMYVTNGYWRKASDLPLLRKLQLNGLINPINMGHKPQDYRCHGQFFYRLTPQGLSLIEQQKLPEVC